LARGAGEEVKVDEAGITRLHILFQVLKTDNLIGRRTLPCQHASLPTAGSQTNEPRQSKHGEVDPVDPRIGLMTFYNKFSR